MTMKDEQHKKYMLRCLDLARMGEGNTLPNPMVGCVIVYNNNIIGEGYHRQDGGPHAEVNAINAVHDKILLKNSTLYVNLEPCSHYGRTPPCVNKIIEHKIPRVIIGAVDPHPKVSGRGINMLKEAGINVNVGISEQLCKTINRRFYTFYEKKRPFIMLKWAQTTDGFVAPEEDKHCGSRPFWIINKTDRMLVHKWRAEEQAIMVGTNTAKKDNPFLDCRNWSGKKPTRIVLDKTLQLNTKLHLFNKHAPTLVFNATHNETKNNIEYIAAAFNHSLLNQIMTNLYNKRIKSVMVEGGTILINSFLKDNLWDEARVFISDQQLEKGCLAPKINQAPLHKEKLDSSCLNTYINL